MWETPWEWIGVSVLKSARRSEADGQGETREAELPHLRGWTGDTGDGAELKMREERREEERKRELWCGVVSFRVRS
jgi:hypothetical protein